jgi:hypothetical protein
MNTHRKKRIRITFRFTKNPKGLISLLSTTTTVTIYAALQSTVFIFSTSAWEYSFTIPKSSLALRYPYYMLCAAKHIAQADGQTISLQSSRDDSFGRDQDPPRRGKCCKPLNAEKVRKLCRHFICPALLRYRTSMGCTLYLTY